MSPAILQHLELRLLHHFTIYTCKTLPGGGKTAISDRWAINVPPLAFEHNALLQTIFAVSSAHLSKLESGNATYQAASRHYFAVALTEHNSAVSTLNRFTADSICLTCLLVRVLAFNSTEVDKNDASTSLLQSLFVGHGCSEIFKTAWRWIRNDPISEASIIVKQSPQFEDVHTGNAQYELLGQLHPQLAYPEEDTTEFTYLGTDRFEDEHYHLEVEKAFRLATSYINFTYRAVQASPRVGYGTLQAHHGLHGKRPETFP